jgi:hypothetical protein
MTCPERQRGVSVIPRWRSGLVEVDASSFSSMKKLQI